MKTVKERLQHFLKEERISASEFARKMGLSPAYLPSMRKSMPEDKVEKRVKIFPQINRDWLLYGEGEMYRAEISQRGLNPYHLHLHMVPLIPTHAAAGPFDMYVNGVNEDDCKPIPDPTRGANLAIRIKGDSMEPEIKNGTIVFLKRINDRAFIPFGSPLVLDTENGSVCKLIFPSEKGEDYLEARSFNKNYPPFQVPLDTVYGIYRIVGEMSEGWTY